MGRSSFVVRIGLLAWGCCAVPAWAGTLAVTSTTPARHAGNVARDTTIAIHFNMPLNIATLTAANFRVSGRTRGTTPGSLAFSNGNQTLTFTPDVPFPAGEAVSVLLSHFVAAADGSPLRAAGYATQFLVVAGANPMSFSEIDEVSVVTNGNQTRLYGGSPADLDNDGWVDYVGVNEVSHDVRVLMNRADGSGLVFPVLEPPSPVGVEASPNEAADFNNDGFMDIATCNSSSNNVSILLGNGDGTFDPQQVVAVASAPHGLAALDVDGDADLDLVSANEGGGNLSLMLNNGSGVFGASAAFDPTPSGGHYGLVAGDMNHDGILDLVVGTRSDNQLHVLSSNGNGTFALGSSRPLGGMPWMLALGDVNGDGNLDLATANGQTDNGSILLGNGNGTLQAAVLSSFDGQMVATDLGDLDGDGDLDWVTSSFGAGRWYVLTNNGAGVFTEVLEIFATNNASCTSIYDFDNDGDLDLALADEIADTVKLVQNSGGPSIFEDGFEAGNVAGWTTCIGVGCPP